MTDDEKLADLLLRWEEAFEQGQEISAEQLCPDCPDLVDKLARRIEALKALAWVKEPVREDAVADDPGEGTLAPPRTLADRYRLENLIGEGGFGQVWRAFDLDLHRPVAVKLPRPSRQFSPAEIDRFLSEARKVARLRHPGIVAVHDICRSGGAYFLVSDLIEGTDLATRLWQGPLPHDEAVRIVAEIARSLAYAHGQGFIHLDIKPANILLDPQGHPLVTDFGIAATEQELLQEPRRLLATLAYASPEQISEQRIDARSDIWSLGVVLYETLTGRLPFDDPNPVALREQIGSSPPAPLLSVPKGLERICRKCLAKNPADRYADAQQLADDLAASLRVRRGGRKVFLGIVILVLVGTGVLVNPWKGRQAKTDFEGDEPFQPLAQEPSPEVEPVSMLQGHSKAVLAIAFSPDGQSVASSGADSTVQVWKVADGMPKKDGVLFSLPVAVTSLAFWPDNRQLACGSENGTIRVWDVSRDVPKETVVLPGHSGPVTCLAFTPNAEHMASGSQDGTVCWWKLGPGPATVEGTPKLGDGVVSVAFSTQADRLLVGVSNRAAKPGKVILWERAEEAGQVRLHHRKTMVLNGVEDVRSVVAAPEGRTYLAATSKMVFVWSRAGTEGPLFALNVFARHEGPVLGVALSPDQHTALSCGADRRLRLWDARTMKEQRSFVGHDHSIRCMALSPDGSWAASGDDSGKVCLWRVASR